MNRKHHTYSGYDYTDWGGDVRVTDGAGRPVLSMERADLQEIVTFLASCLPNSGAVPVLLSREAVEALRRCTYHKSLLEEATLQDVLKLLSLLARDLAEVLK